MLHYLRATWLPLLLTIGFASINNYIGTTNLIVYFITLIAAVIFLIDTVGRTKDYIMLKSRFQQGSKSKLYWEAFSNTRCSREVMCAVDPKANAYYNLIGYKWYHIFPDGTFTRKSPVLSVKFWKNLLFLSSRG